jgi:hypothetical protein
MHAIDACVTGAAIAAREVPTIDRAVGGAKIAPAVIRTVAVDVINL